MRLEARERNIAILIAELLRDQLPRFKTLGVSALFLYLAGTCLSNGKYALGASFSVIGLGGLCIVNTLQPGAQNRETVAKQRLIGSGLMLLGLASSAVTLMVEKLSDSPHSHSLR